MTDDDILNAILKREGGFVHHPNDRGGPTKYGITQATLGEHRRAYVTVDDMRALTEAEAREIYRARYLGKFGAIEPPALRGLLVDCAVLHGVGGAARLVQAALGVDPAGIAAKVAEIGAQQAYLRVVAARVRFIGRIITADPSQARFAHGWANRVADFIEDAP